VFQKIFTMEIQGKIIKILPLQSGESARGAWKKQDFVIETTGQYPKKVCLTLWGDKVDQANITEGEDITASINIESREFNERWYTEVKAWKIVKGMGATTNTSQTQSSENTPPPPTMQDMPQGDDKEFEDDLPF